MAIFGEKTVIPLKWLIVEQKHPRPCEKHLFVYEKTLAVSPQCAGEQFNEERGNRSFSWIFAEDQQLYSVLISDSNSFKIGSIQQSFLGRLHHRRRRDAK